MIKSITIEVCGKEIVLTLDEAKSLRDSLNEAIPQPVYQPPYPIYIKEMDRLPSQPPVPWCDSGTGQQSILPVRVECL